METIYSIKPVITAVTSCVQALYVLVALVTNNWHNIPVMMLGRVHHVYTDTEPDDYWFIQAHAYFYPNVWTIYVIGESRPEDKIAEFVEILQALRPFNNYSVVQGLPSKKKFPIPQQAIISPDSEQVILERFKELPKPTHVFQLKPMREEMMVTVDRSDVECYCYGSFNWRSLNKNGSKKEIDLEGINRMIATYKKYYYYDTFHAIGHKNSGTLVPMPGFLHSAIQKFQSTRWNTFQMDDSAETVKQLDVIDTSKMNEDQLKDHTEKRHRNQKIVDSIKPHVETQFVMADVLLLYVEKPTIPVRLVGFNPGGYPIWEPDTTSNLFIHDISGDNQERRHAKLVEDLKKPFYELENPLTKDHNHMEDVD